GAGLAGLAREAAEGAREDADVGRRDVAVDDEVHAITLAPGLDVIGHAPNAQEVVGLEEGEAVLAAQALARADPVPDGLETAVTESHGTSPRPACARRSGWSIRMLAAAVTGCQGWPGRGLVLHGAGGEAGDVIVDEEGVDQRHRDGAQQRGGHQLAPV